MEKISFIEILKESWDTSFSRPSFFLLSFFVAVPMATQVIIFPDTSFAETTWQTFATTHPFPLFALLCFFFVFKLFGKSNLIIALYRSTQKDTSETPSLQRQLFINFKKALGIDLTVMGFFLLLCLILALPLLISFSLSGTISETLLILSGLILIPVMIISFFIREFSFFYFLLSPLRLKASFEASATLFTKKRSLCLSFGLFALLQAILFTFFLNLAMLGIVALSQKIAPFLSETILVFCGTLLCLTWYEVFKQVLWLNFFKRLAAPKNPTAEEVSDTLFKEKVSEIPLA